MKYTQSGKFIRNLIMLICMLPGMKTAKAGIPRPDHTVVLVLENHAYWQVISSASAPYLNSLSQSGANLVEYYALTHPSQPNYIMMFSGDNQGVTDDNLPAGTPWTAPNLGAYMINSGLTFKGYSQSLPTTGSTIEYNGGYGRKHAPWVHWQGTGTNQIPAYCNETMDNFPTDYTQLPDLSFVIPDMDHDMHNGTDPSRIADCDAWVQSTLGDYVNWAMGHNSLLIVTFDEDDNYASNHIPCFFVGPMVQQGNYVMNGYNHYDMLRTLEDMFNLPYAGASSNAVPIEEVWLINSVRTVSSEAINSIVYPNPVSDQANIQIDQTEVHSSGKLILSIVDAAGKEVRAERVMVTAGQKSVPFKREGLTAGMYFYSLRNDEQFLARGKFSVE